MRPMARRLLPPHIAAIASLLLLLLLHPGVGVVWGVVVDPLNDPAYSWITKGSDLNTVFSAADDLTEQGEAPTSTPAPKGLGQG